MTLAETNIVLDELAAQDLSKYPADSITSLISKFRRFPAHVTEFHTGNVIYRVRPNENGKSFEKISDLKYKPQEYNTTYQRASSPNKTMFYGTIIPHDNTTSEIDNGRVIAAAEGSKVFRKEEITEGIEIVTFGMWRLQSTVGLITILNPEVERNNSPFAINRARAFMAWLEQYPEVAEQGKAILKFYSEQYAKRIEWGQPDYHYMHSALLTEFFTNKGFDGVLYPSGRVDGKGLNVAIAPEFVDAHMRLEGVMECVVAKKGDQIVCDNLKVAWLNAGDTTFNWNELSSMEQIQNNIKAILG